MPVICPPLYFAMGGRRNTTGRMHFAARDDMFVPGFFARFPPDLAAAGATAPLRRRRQVAPARERLPRSAARASPAWARCSPTRPATRLPSSSRRRPSRRSRHGPLPAASTLRRGGDVLHGSYADLLWEPLARGRGASRKFWSRRAGQPGDFRTLVEIVRDGNVLIVFPEGRPSPDGEIGPIKPGIGALVRRGKPRAIRPLALAYDPLVRGRTRVHLALGEPSSRRRRTSRARCSRSCG